MTQFAVYRDKSHPRGPLLLNVQSNLITALNTTVVVPLYPASAFKGKRLQVLLPEFSVAGKQFVMMTPQLAGIPTGELGEQVADLSSERGTVLAALDLLITGI